MVWAFQNVANHIQLWYNIWVQRGGGQSSVRWEGGIVVWASRSCSFRCKNLAKNFSNGRHCGLGTEMRQVRKGMLRQQIGWTNGDIEWCEEVLELNPFSHFGALGTLACATQFSLLLSYFLLLFLFISGYFLLIYLKNNNTNNCYWFDFLCYFSCYR